MEIPINAAVVLFDDYEGDDSWYELKEILVNLQEGA